MKKRLDLKKNLILIWKRVTHIMTTTKAFIVSALAIIGLFILVSIALFYYGKDNYYAPEYYSISKTMDSLETEVQLESIIKGDYIVSYDNYYRPFWGRDNMTWSYADLRYLPYCYVALLDERYLPHYIASNYNFMVDLLCDSPVDSVYNLGNSISTRLIDKYSKLCWPDSLSNTEMQDDRANINWTKPTPKVQIDGKIYDPDSLRIRVIGFNDRNALALLEKYYTTSGSMKELAVYYRIMSGFEGNGDLAERYYTVLKPYLAEQPEYFNSISDVLLRAAMCDHNERAQQLCDSLGISFCDYRLPVLEE